jgi:acyl-CoA synthetase (AMP-forming)/AMP-acid ligase II
MLGLLFDAMGACASSGRSAVIYGDRVFSYGDLLERIEYCDQLLDEKGICPGRVVIIRSDFSLDSIALFISTIRNDCIVVPIVGSDIPKEEIVAISQADAYVQVAQDGQFGFETIGRYECKTGLLADLTKERKPGLIFFTSGSTGKPKATHHNVENLFIKYKSSKKAYRTLAFLLFDHIAGIDTVFYTLFAGGTVIIPSARDPRSVLETIERFQVEVFSTTPSFLNWMFLTEDLDSFDLSSLKIITFGSERMSESTMSKMQERFGNRVRLMQKYGTTEFGSPVSKSRDDDPLWIKFKKENFDYKVVDNRLFVKSPTSMMGYLNDVSGKMVDGWMDTGDTVEVDGEWMKILGRESDIINVGGQKVYPPEVESVLLEMENISDVSVYGAPNPIMGHVVAARINLLEYEPVAAVKKRIRLYCRDRLETFKIPASVEVTEEKLVSDRFKKVR